ncbi:MAG TPA: prepilin-type N-terminal cleavage/methylation domain-containing protein [Vicinamibacterales bacterium]|nr:prepilin-type N-terminal cleavage/methylation domain-containing protein [Vicinamibacterales bacterium]
MTQSHSRVLPNSSRYTRGFTLAELMIGLAVMGLLTLTAMPRITRIVDRAQVKSARTAAFNHLASARLAAQHGGRLVVFRTAGGTIWSEAQPRLVALFGSTRDTLGPVTDLAGQYRLTMTATFDSIVFDPRGLGTGTGMILLTRGTSMDSVLVTGLGSVIR